MEICPKCGKSGVPYYTKYVSKTKGIISYYKYYRHSVKGEVLGSVEQYTCHNRFDVLSQEQYNNLNLSLNLSKDDKEELVKLEKRLIQSRSKTSANLVNKIIRSIKDE